MAKPEAYFTPDTLKFLRGLARHNDKTWFAEHKPQYEAYLRQPFLRLIADLSGPLHDISAHFIADPRPVGGSMFRIHRDTRFAKDKSPYKPWAGARLYHERARELDQDTPVFYLHIQPGNSFVGGGLWHPMPPTLKRVRDYLLNNPRSWTQATQSAAFTKRYTLGGESLSRPPRGYDPNHALIADLKRKDFVCMTPLSDEDLLSPKLLALLTRQLQGAGPLVDWLCGALDLEF